ncbi:MAG: hypothetical protein HY078_04560 [Elusimicrobia bacterium]|nr:hypothetical protein [Elusimicrobiota bacterium]
MIKRLLASMIAALTFSTAPAFAEYSCGWTRNIPAEEIGVLKEALAGSDASAAAAVLKIGRYNYFSWAVCEGDANMFVFLVNSIPAEGASSARYNLARSLQEIIVYRPRNFLSPQQLFDRGLPIEVPVAHLGVGMVDETPILAAVTHMRADVELVKYLIGKGANIFATNRERETALHKAMHYIDPYFIYSADGAKPYFEIADALLEAAGPRKAELLHFSDRYGRTPLSTLTSWAPRDDRSPGYDAYYAKGVEATAQGEAIETLLKAGADINFRGVDEKGQIRHSAVHRAVLEGNPALVEYLIERGANPAGWEPLIRPDWESWFDASSSSGRKQLERGRRMIEILKGASSRG